MAAAHALTATYERHEGLQVGVGQVIKGWDEGVPQMSKGAACDALPSEHLH
jgi:FKBP-type peptidyl-prolyl cis-trans isomerase